MILTTNPDPNAIELITIRKDEYEAMREKIKNYEKGKFKCNGCKKYHSVHPALLVSCFDCRSKHY